MSKETLLKFRRWLSYINFPLYIFNWIINPIKIVLFIIFSFITKIIEPYKSPIGFPTVHSYSELEEKANRFEERIDDIFTYKGFILPYINGIPAHGRNHDRGDWCIWNGMYLAYLCFKYRATLDDRLFGDIKTFARQYVDNWIDDDGYLRRGWYWNGENKEYEYRISGDQIAGFVYGLSLVPITILKGYCSDRILLFVNRIIKDKYVINDPDEGRTYWRDYRLGLLSYGPMPATILAILKLAYNVTGFEKYNKEYKKFLIRDAGWMYLLFPFGKLFEWFDDFAHNVIMISLSAHQELTNSKLSRFGINWTWWINRKVYNPFWNLLKEFYSGKLNTIEQEITIYMLSTVDHNNFNDTLVNNNNIDLNFGDVDSIKIKKYFRLFGGKYTTLPPKYSQKLSDVFMFQRIERQVKHFGERLPELRTDENYNMVYYLLSFYIYKNLY